MNRILFFLILFLSFHTLLIAQNYPTISSQGDYVEKYTKSNNGFEIGVANATNARRSWILTRHSDVPNFGKYYSSFHLQPDIGDQSQYRGVAIGYGANEIIPIKTYLSINGKVGVGTLTPNHFMDVIAKENNGSENVLKLGVSDAPNDYLSFFNATGSEDMFIPSMRGYFRADNRPSLFVGGMITGANDNGNWAVVTFDARSDNSFVGNRNLFAWRNYTSEVMTLSHDGNLGIGTTTPDSKLSVNGNIRAREIKLETGNWPDYVFEEGYQQMSLEEVEAFIAEHGHLPGLKSAEEYQEEGVDMMELNQKLLEKIEELTLYLIDKENRLQRMEKDNKKLKSNEARISALEMKLEALLEKRYYE